MGAERTGRSVLLSAPAKLNLHLGIYPGRDERGYHRADSLMVALDLADEVEVTDFSEGHGTEAFVLGECPRIVCVPPVDVPDQKNTVYRAAVELAQRVRREPLVCIRLVKRVPDQAGMGGSSSDAAATLKGLCELWDLETTDERVVESARAVGADVPFFLDCVPTLLVGAGDVVAEKFPRLSESLSVVLLRPNGPGVSTPAAYAAFDERPENPQSVDELCALLRGGRTDAAQIAEHLANNLDPVACRLLPQVGAVRTWLLAQDGVRGGQVTGSGSCVFGICENDETAERVVRAANECLDVWACVAHAR